MAPMLYVMAILGCGDASAACQTVRVADTLYASAAACEAAAGAVLGRNTDLDFPVVETRCQAERAEAAQARLASLPRG